MIHETRSTQPTKLQKLSSSLIGQLIRLGREAEKMENRGF